MSSHKAVCSMGYACGDPDCEVHYPEKYPGLRKPGDPGHFATQFMTKDPANPKDMVGAARIDLTLIHVVALIEEALAMQEGLEKYGAYNYLAAKVKARIYVGAAFRHLFKWLMGEERDPKTGVHHLGSVRACAGILLAAQAHDTLVDDRPPSLKGASDKVDSMEARVKHLRELYKGFRPKHFTRADDGTREPIHPAGPQAPAEGDLPREDAQRVPGRDA